MIGRMVPEIVPICTMTTNADEVRATGGISSVGAENVSPLQASSKVRDFGLG
ncbi:hypothetical protein [Paraburkholderia dinghuensis]|uniref:hypothetical protein n=1 Tax=Paraburkholderia dinghuensis TaxID=2305225 RepID=UPI001627AAA9|nr:hypothetical protein [Paraburkholderia dinghuensis]